MTLESYTFIAPEETKVYKCPIAPLWKPNRFNLWRSWFKFLLITVFRPIEYTRNEPNSNYPQSWYWVTKIRPRFLQCMPKFLCGILTGHELSKTEWGYGGGRYADRWCRWCNKRFLVPKESIYFQFKESDPKELMSMVGKDA